MPTKSIFKSKVFWVALAQAIAGVAVVFSTAYPQAGALLIVKSCVDILLRLLTEQPAGL